MSVKVECDLLQGDLRTAICSIGEGDVRRGRKIVIAIGEAIFAARGKHPAFAESAQAALDVIGDELMELDYAIDKESPARQRAEAMDVAVVALRFWNGEFAEDDGR